MRRLWPLLGIVVVLVLLCAPLVACSFGQPATLAPAPAAVAVAPVQTFGFRPEVKAAAMIPPDVAACFVAGGARILGDAIDTVRCALDHLTPIVNPPAPAAYAAPAAPCAPAAAPAAPSCPSGACGLPGARK